MTWQPGRGALACAACGQARVLPEPTADERERALREQDYVDALRRLAAREPALEARVVDCPSCGAQTRFDGHVVGDRCAFCASPLLLDQAHLERRIRPQAVLPFTVEHDAAQQAFARWVASRWFAPNALKRTVREADGVRGVYLPWWTYDADTFTTYRGERGVNRQERDDRGNGQSTTRTVTDWSPTAGAVSVPFDDLLVVGSSSIPPHLARVLEGWPLQELRPPADELLAGFTVEVDRTGLEAGFAQARAAMDGAIDDAIRRHIGGDAQRIHARHTEVGGIRFRHLLLPVWIGSYRYGGRPYRIVVNGRTGTLAGDRPWSPWKIGFAVLAALAVVLLFQYLQQG